MLTGDQELQTTDQRQSCANSQAMKHPTDSENSDRDPRTYFQNIPQAGSQTNDQDHETDSENVHQSCSQTSDREFQAILLESNQGEHQIDPQSKKYEPQAFTTHDSSERTGPLLSGTCSDDKECPSDKDNSTKLPPDTNEPMADVAQEGNEKLPTSCERDGQHHGVDRNNKPAVPQEIQVNTCLSGCKY